MSVQAHVVSPHSAGLLAGAIAQSGSILYLSTQTPGQEQVGVISSLELFYQKCLINSTSEVC